MASTTINRRAKARKQAPKPKRAVSDKPITSAAAAETGVAKRLLRAGVKALGEVQGDVLARQGRIFEVLLGIGQVPGWPVPTRKPADDGSDADPFGKFEDVFDERVARSLQRLGMPSAAELTALREKVERLTEALSKLESPRRRR